MTAISSLLMPKRPKVPAPTPAPTGTDEATEEARRKERLAAQMAMGRSALDNTRGTGGSTAPVLKSQHGA